MTNKITETVASKRKKIVLIGPIGCGKSSTGIGLANALSQVYERKSIKSEEKFNIIEQISSKDFPMTNDDTLVKFIDADKFFIKREQFMDLNEIYNRYGKEEFLKREAANTMEILSSDELEIVSVSATALLDKEVADVIFNQCISVFLKINKYVAWQRVERRNTRPILEYEASRLAKITDKPKTQIKQELCSEYFDQVILLEKKANILVSADNYSTKDILIQIFKQLKNIL